jgi:hypothetical protein
MNLESFSVSDTFSKTFTGISGCIIPHLGMFAGFRLPLPVGYCNCFFRLPVFSGLESHTALENTTKRKFNLL